jgi:uncharacterized protein
MPVKSPRSGNGSKKSVAEVKHDLMHDFVKKIYLTLGGILLVYVIVFVGVLIRNNLEQFYYIGHADRAERTITLEASGKVTATPDIATVTMGMEVTADSVNEAQEQNTNAMNTLLSRLEALGIDKADVQTSNYSVFPEYNYTQDEGRVLQGYRVNQNVTVKIRDLSKSNNVIALAGAVGANNVSGLNFTIDDTEVYKAQTRDEALRKIAVKAKVLSKSLGVKLVGVAGYNEFDGGGRNPVAYRDFAVAESGFGGAPAPQIEAGSLDVMLNVSVTFEIR